MGVVPLSELLPFSQRGVIVSPLSSQLGHQKSFGLSGLRSARGPLITISTSTARSHLRVSSDRRWTHGTVGNFFCLPTIM